MKEVEVTLQKMSNIGHFDRDEIVTYYLKEETANILITGGDGTHEDVNEMSKARFQEDIKTVLRMAKKEIPTLRGKIANNAMVFANMRGAGREKEMEKARKHRERNEERLDIIKNFIDKYDDKEK